MDSEAAAMPTMEPQHENHQWLMQLVGDWEYTGVTTMGPGEEAHKSQGSESVRALGELWIMGDGVHTMSDGDQMLTVITLGYNNLTGRLFGSWVGSCMSGLWVYDGELDSNRKVLTLNCQGPSMEDHSKLINYQDIVELVSPDHRTLRSQMQREDGSWTEMMRADYKRVG
jgi:hypothetical protein